MYPDFLTCGRCADEFPLSKMVDFIIHKVSCLQPQGETSADVQTIDNGLGQQKLFCFFCQQDFHTARGVLQHVQYVHHMVIVLPTSYASTDHLYSCQDKQHFTLQKSTMMPPSVMLYSGSGSSLQDSTTQPSAVLTSGSQPSSLEVSTIEPSVILNSGTQRTSSTLLSTASELSTMLNSGSQHSSSTLLSTASELSTMLSSANQPSALISSGSQSSLVDSAMQPPAFLGPMQQSSAMLDSALLNSSLLAPEVPFMSPILAEHIASHSSSTSTTLTDSQPTTAADAESARSTSSSEKSELSVMCAKLSTTKGTTICCNGSECKVTIQPPTQTSSQKKCCSAVVPKKRKRHMQEHDSEDMEQSALETLATFRGRFLINQKSKMYQKKGRCKHANHKSKASCVQRCEREDSTFVGLGDTAEDCHGKKDKQCDENKQKKEKKKDEYGTNNSKCEANTDNDKQTIEIYSIEKEELTSKKTVLTNSGVTVTFAPTKKTSKESEIPLAPKLSNVSPHNQSALIVDTAAQILTDLIYPQLPSAVEHSLPLPSTSGSNLTANANVADIQSSLISLAEVCASSSLTKPVADIPQPSTGAGSDHSTNPVNFSTNLTSPPNNNLSIPMASKVPGQMAVASSQQASNLQLVHPQPFPPSLSIYGSPDRGSREVLPDIPFLFTSQNMKQGAYAGSAGDVGERRTPMYGKKRRYPTSRPHKCSECNQAFNQTIHLKKHMSKHTGVKPFKCENCDYSTVERSHLKAHIRIHTGEKPFRCQFCSYATTQNSTLKVHLKRHHQEKHTTGSGSC